MPDFYMPIIEKTIKKTAKKPVDLLAVFKNNFYT